MGITSNLEKMLAAGRDDAMLRFGLGSAYFNEGNYEQAALHLQSCVDQDENYSAAYKLLGKAYYKLGDMEKASSIFEKGLPIAQGQGDKQTEKEINVFLKKTGK